MKGKSNFIIISLLFVFFLSGIYVAALAVAEEPIFDPCLVWPGDEDYPNEYPVEWNHDEFVGTTLEGANAFPSIVLPENRSSGCTWDENDMVFYRSYKGFLPPDDYCILGSRSLLKMVKEICVEGIANYDYRHGKTRRFENLVIDVFPNGITESYDVIDIINKAFEGDIFLRIVDSIPIIGLVFVRTDSHCGNAGKLGNETAYHHGLWEVQLGTGCGRWKNNINNGIHEVIHALGYNSHTTIQNTSMSLGGRWNDLWADPSGIIDPVTVAVIRQLYALPPGTDIDSLIAEAD